MARERLPSRSCSTPRSPSSLDKYRRGVRSGLRKLAGCPGYVSPLAAALEREYPRTRSGYSSSYPLVAVRPGSLPARTPCYTVQTMSARPLSRIRQLITLCMLAAAVVTIGLAIAGALTGARSPVPQLASQK